MPDRISYNKSISKSSLHTPEQPHNQEPARADKSDSTEHSDTVQHNAHVDRRALLLSLVSVLVSAATDIDTVDTTGVEHDSSESQVAEHPSEDNGRAETLVIILVLLLLRDDALGSLPLGGKSAEFGLVLRVEIGVVGGNVDVDFAARFERRGGQFLGLVVALGAPGDVVGVAEGVDVEDVDVGGRQEEVLQEAGGHVPWVEEEERGEEVQQPGRAHTDDEGEEELVREEHGEREAAGVDLFHDGLDGDEDRGEEEVTASDG